MASVSLKVFKKSNSNKITHDVINEVHIFINGFLVNFIDFTISSTLVDLGSGKYLGMGHGVLDYKGDSNLNKYFIPAIDKSKYKLNSTKSMLGHSLGAAGAMEAVACLQSIATGSVHPTINHDDPEDGVDFDVVPNEAQEFKVNVALSNSFGFGGHNSSVLFGAFEG